MSCLLCDTSMVQMPTWRQLFCNDIGETVCGRCKSNFKLISEPGCAICSLPGKELCMDCENWEATRFSGTVTSGKSLYLYNEAMKAYLHQYKFLQDVELSTVFAADMNRALEKEQGVLVPIPMNEEHLKERTFSQVDSALDGAKLNYTHLLEKTGEVQGKKSKMERMAVAQLFKWNGSAIPKKIVLVDDLYTTGTTMRHAAWALKQAGAEEISLFSLIRAY